MKPTELMKACGSKSGSWEPESRDHWLWLLRNGEGPERALAWVKLKSIGNNSPCAIDEAGRALTIDSMAADLGWSMQTAKNVCSLLVEEGRIRTQKGRLWYRADVPESNAGSVDGEDEKYSVHGIFPSYLLDFIKSLPPEKKAVVDAYVEWRPKFFAEGLAALRAIDERVQDTTLAQVGCKEKKHLPKRRQDLQWVQLELATEPNFVHGTGHVQGPKSVQNGNGTSHKVAAASVQNGVHTSASLLPSAPTLDSTKRHATSSSQLHADSALVALRLQLDDDAARRLLDRTREVERSITPRELVHLAIAKLSQIDRRQVKNPVGLLLAALPKAATGGTLAAARKAAAEEIEKERRAAQTWLDADPRDWADAIPVLEKSQADARATLARLASECGHSLTKGQHA